MTDTPNLFDLALPRTRTTADKPRPDYPGDTWPGFDWFWQLWASPRKAEK